MNKQSESIIESYLKKICDQNDEIINILKSISCNFKGVRPSEDDERKILIEKMERLTKRERQIIDLIMVGMLNKQMAYELAVSLSTIETHRSSIMRKIGVKNVTQLTQEYMKYQSLKK